MGRRKYTIDDWRVVKKRLKAGWSIREAAARAGVDRNAAIQWSCMDEPPDWMWANMATEAGAGASSSRAPGARLTYEDRVMIWSRLCEGDRPGEIAVAVGCHRTTVSRELARMPEGGYDPRGAQRIADAAARRPKGRKLDENPGLHAYVVDKLLLFMESASNVVIEGCTGTGKSHLACCLAKQACRKRRSARYVRLPDLLMERDELAATERSNAKILKKYARYEILVLDEWLAEDVNDVGISFLFELIERRYATKSTVLCTQYTPSRMARPPRWWSASRRNGRLPSSRIGSNRPRRRQRAQTARR